MVELNVNRVISRALKSDWEGCAPQQWGDYCVVDGARSPEIHDAASRAGEESACLYDGKLPFVLARAAPYIVKLHRNSHFTRLFYERGWGNAWGIVLRGPTSLAATRRHLRTLNYVQTVDRKKLLFRFYDPRVLRLFLPSCNRQQLELLFGPLGAFVMEDEQGSHVVTFGRDDEGRLISRREELPRSSPARSDT